MHGKHQVLFVQGGGKGTHDEWDHKLVDSLRGALGETGETFEVLYPRMPKEDDPKYARWKPALVRELGALRAGAILIGHSVGGTMLMGALAELTPAAPLRAICLVAAPFVGEGGWPSDDLQLSLDLGARLPEGVPVHLFQGLADETVPPSHAALWARALPQAQVHRLAGRDHQLGNDMKEVAATIAALTARR